ncbi:MAG: tetratricopeptide repeat protein [Bacteroidia bacterium]|nr:tetratricopeptide repeat protein [Bacteroidia bacterium]
MKKTRVQKRSKPEPEEIKSVSAQDAASLTMRWAYLFVALLAVLIYCNTLNHDFTVDDGTVMQNNTIVKRGVSAIPEIFSTRYRAGFWDRKENLYRPLSLVMFAAEWQITGGKPWLGHIVNVMMYALICVLVLFLFRKLLVKHHPLIPFAAALLFAVHPLHTEVVANIKSRDELLCLLFSLLAMISALKYVEWKKVLWMAASAFCFLLALLSKENAIAMMAIIPLLLWFFTDEKIKGLILPSAMLAAVTGIYLFIRASVLQGLEDQTELQIINNSMLGAEGFSRFMMAVYLMGKYLWMHILPHPLSFDYSFNTIKSETASSPLAWLSLLIHAGLVVYALMGLKNKNPLAFCILFYFGTIALVSNILFLIEATFAERFVFMPSLGFCLAVALLLSKISKLNLREKNLLQLKSNPVLSSALILILVLFSLKTISRNFDWKNNLTLLARDVKTYPESARIRYAYGSALLFEQAIPEKNKEKRNRLLDEAIVQLEKGVSILSTYADAFYHLGLAYKDKGDAVKAVAAFEAAKRSKTWTAADFYVSSGLAYGAANRYAEAIKDLHRATEIATPTGEMYNNLGMFHTESGNTDSAKYFLEKAKFLSPESPGVLYNLGNAFAKAGNFTTAILHYAEAIKIDSLYEDAYNNTGNSYAAMKDFNNALHNYMKVYELNPQNQKVLNNIAVTYYMLGDTANARRYMEMIKK